MHLRSNKLIPKNTTAIEAIHLWLIVISINLKIILSVRTGAEGSDIYSQATDIFIISLSITLIVSNFKLYMRLYSSLIISISSVFCIILILELIQGYSFYAIVFSILKFLEPFMLLLALSLFFEKDGRWLIKKIQILIILIVGLSWYGVYALPPSMNRGEIWLPAYFSGLHTSSYILMLVGFITYTLYSLKEFNNIALAFLFCSSLFLLFCGWGVRTAQLGVVIFFALNIMIKRFANNLFWNGFILIFLTLPPIFTMLNLVEIPSFEETIFFTSGRIAMWDLKLKLLLQSSWFGIFFGNGPGSDLVYSDIWWWALKGSHNDYLTVLTEYGVVGFLLFCSIMFLFFRTYWCNFTCRSIILVYLFCSLVSNGIMFRPLVGVLFSLTLLSADFASKKAFTIDEKMV